MTYGELCVGDYFIYPEKDKEAYVMIKSGDGPLYVTPQGAFRIYDRRGMAETPPPHRIVQKLSKASFEKRATVDPRKVSA